MPAPTTVIKYNGANYGLFLNNITAPAGDLTHLLPPGNENGPFGLVGMGQEIVFTSIGDSSGADVFVTGYDVLGYLRTIEFPGPIPGAVSFTNVFLKNIISVKTTAPVNGLSIGVGSRGTTDLILLSPYREAPYNLIDVNITEGSFAGWYYNFMYTPDQFRSLLLPDSQNQDPNSPFGPFFKPQLIEPRPANLAPNFNGIRCIDFRIPGSTGTNEYTNSQTYNSPGPLATAVWIKFGDQTIQSINPGPQTKAEVTFIQAGSYTC
jgi:hypothetical protein